MRDIFLLSLPLTIWLILFSALYGLHALACEAGWGGADLGRVLLLGTAVAGIACQGVLLGFFWRRRRHVGHEFVGQVSLALAAVGLVATVWIALPVAALPMCSA